MVLYKDVQSKVNKVFLMKDQQRILTYASEERNLVMWKMDEKSSESLKIKSVKVPKGYFTLKVDQNQKFLAMFSILSSVVRIFDLESLEVKYEFSFENGGCYSLMMLKRLQ